MECFLCKQQNDKSEITDNIQVLLEDGSTERILEILEHWKLLDLGRLEKVCKG